MEHLRAVEDVEQFLELIIGKSAEALMNREVFAEFLPNGLRPRSMVPMEHPSGEVVRLQRLDRRLRREARAGESRKDSASGHRFRLACCVSDDEDVVRVGATGKTKRDSARDVQDRLGPFR